MIKHSRVGGWLKEHLYILFPSTMLVFRTKMAARMIYIDNFRIFYYRMKYTFLPLR